MCPCRHDNFQQFLHQQHCRTSPCQCDLLYCCTMSPTSTAQPSVFATQVLYCRESTPTADAVSPAFQPRDHAAAATQFCSRTLGRSRVPQEELMASLRSLRKEKELLHETCIILLRQQQLMVPGPAGKG